MLAATTPHGKQFTHTHTHTHTHTPRRVVDEGEDNVHARLEGRDMASKHVCEQKSRHLRRLELGKQRVGACKVLVPDD